MQLERPVNDPVEKVDHLSVTLLIQVHMGPGDVGVGLVETAVLAGGRDVAPDVLDDLAEQGAAHGGRELGRELVVEPRPDLRPVEVLECAPNGRGPYLLDGAVLDQD